MKILLKDPLLGKNVKLEDFNNHSKRLLSVFNRIGTMSWRIARERRAPRSNWIEWREGLGAGKNP